MSLSLELTGFDAFADRLQGMGPRLQTEMGRAVAATTLALHGDIIERVSQPGSGRLYTRRGVTHQASAPGEPPAPDTGSYRASIQPDLTDVGTRLEGRVATNDRRGPWLEYGTRNMAPRPHFAPALEAIRPVFLKNGTLALTRTLEGS